MKAMPEALQEEVSEATGQSNDYLYVYGIVNKDIELNMAGLRNEPIHKINFKDIFILASSYPTLYPILEDDEAMQHAGVLNKIVKKTAVVPMAFGAVFKDRQILDTVISKSYDAIKETLKLITGKFELGVKVIKSKSNETNNENEIIRDIVQSLNNLSVKSLKGDAFSERLLLNYSFLAEKNNFSKFSREIARLEKKYKDLKFIYTGPWPPHSFIDIKINGGGACFSLMICC